MLLFVFFSLFLHGIIKATYMINNLFRKFFLTLLLTAWTVCGIASTPLTSKIITTRNGLASNQVNDLIQDRYGFIWLATSNGLSRYDGYSFLNYQEVGCGAGLLKDNIGTLSYDHDNDLIWIRTATFKYACYDLKKGIFVDFIGTHDPQKTFSRFVTRGNDMWMYDPLSGIRHITYNEGKFDCHDYSSHEGNFPDCKTRRIVIDDQGLVWISTDQGLLRYGKNGQMETIRQGEDFMVSQTYQGMSFFLTNNLKVYIYGKDGKLKKQTLLPYTHEDKDKYNSSFVWQDKWVIMSNASILTMDCKDFHFDKPQDLQMGYGILLDDYDGNYWVSDINGTLYLFPSQGDIKKFKLFNEANIRFSVNKKRNFSTILGKDGQFYIATSGNGLFVYNPTDEQMSHYTANEANSILATNYLDNIHVDRDGNIWIGQEDAGIACIQAKALPDVNHVVPDPLHKGAYGNYIRGTIKKEDGSILIRTRSHELFTLSPETGIMRKTGTEPFDKNQTDSLTDRYGHVWIGTWEQGLLMTCQTKDGKTVKKQFLTQNTTESRVNALAIDNEDRLWIGTYAGLYVVDTRLDDITDNSFRHLGVQEGLPSNNIICLLVTRDGLLCIGGQDFGIILCKMNKTGSLNTTTFSTNQGLASNLIYSMTEDLQGRIWAGTGNEISCINLTTKKVRNYHVGTTYMNNIYSQKCALTLDDGRVLFGTHDGITLLNPSIEEEQKHQAHKPRITDVSINGKSIYVNNIPAETPYIGNQLRLAHNENSLTIYFSSLDYANLEQSMYQFYLEGLENEWHEPSTQHSVDYNNLSPGKYVFHLRTSEDEEETTYNIIIRQPWYNTWWAWMVYLLFVGIAGWTFYRYKRERFLLHQQMKLEKEMTEFRINFFTQIAHEFRTPLAIISGAVDKMSGGNPSKNTILSTRRGVKRLSTLVNQLMEFRKVQTGNLRLQVEQGDIIGFVRDICQDFWHVAEQKEQSLTFTPFAKKHIMLFDRHIVDTIVYNLISNAVKYTPQGGTITVRMKKDDGQIEMVIEDSGKGIDKERQTMLFHPFMHGYASQGGMGIGLYTAHRMAQTHKGTLSYKPSETLGGSAFTLILPADDSIYGPDDYGQTKTAVKTEEREGQADQVIREMLPQALNDKRVAIIEDEPDMLEQIKAEMAVYFHVSGYTDGQSGLEGIHEERPSLLICDIMLPDTNGYEVVKRMKGDEALKDIPVIMLTALDDERHHIKGYEAGADDYMTKPCNYRILIARAIQLIRWKEERESVSERPEGSTERLPEKSTILTSQADKRFLERVNLLISQHLSNPDYTIDQMAETMKMGRTKFYGKVKDLTGLSPNKLFMSERMRKAAVLLDEGELNISEIGFRVGIPDPSYFNRCFKQHFGVTPGQYQKNK